MKLPKININKFMKIHLSTVYIFPRSIREKTGEYDPDRQEEETNFTLTPHNPIPLKCYIRNASPEGLIAREIGLSASLVKELWVSTKYVDLIKNAERIVINKEDYSPYHKATGNKFQIYEKKGNLNLVEILIFRKEEKE